MKRDMEAEKKRALLKKWEWDKIRESIGEYLRQQGRDIVIVMEGAEEREYEKAV